MEIIMGIIIITAILIWIIYKNRFYKSKNFLDLKNDLSSHIQECNEFNEHLEELKNNSFDFLPTNYGSVKSEVNIGKRNYKRKNLDMYANRHNVYDCSLSVFKNAKEQPFKYLCKYFNIEISEESIAKLENTLNDFTAAEQGKKLLVEKEKTLLESRSSDIPYLIRKFDYKRLNKELEFNPINLANDYFPSYTFRYISGAGNSGQSFSIVFNPENLEAFIEFLSERVKFKKTAKGQRALMTRALREKIKTRDHFACCNCSVSVQDEPHLLLEIDHIIPIAKGGLTTEDNLQTLCWKCNRSKGTKTINPC